MADKHTFTLSEAEARRMRRGAFLPILLILPMTAMFGLDSSKSQPMHFLMTFAVASGIAAVVVSMGWYGAKRRIAEFAGVSLVIADGRITWSTATRRTELDLSEVTRIDVQETRGTVRTIVLVRTGGARTTLEGYERMNDLLDGICKYSAVDIVRTSRWLGL
jgi:hypothetical protein